MLLKCRKSELIDVPQTIAIVKGLTEPRLLYYIYMTNYCFNGGYYFTPLQRDCMDRHPVDLFVVNSIAELSEEALELIIPLPH